MRIGKPYRGRGAIDTLTAIVRVKPAPGKLHRIPELALRIPGVGECHRITGEDCFSLKVHLRSIEELTGLLDQFLAFGETTTSIINASPILHRDPPIPERARPERETHPRVLRTFSTA